MIQLTYCRNCRQPMDSADDFCMKCGADQRPPPRRSPSSPNLNPSGVQSHGSVGAGKTGVGNWLTLFDDLGPKLSVVVALIWGVAVLLHGCAVLIGSGDIKNLERSAYGFLFCTTVALAQSKTRQALGRVLLSLGVPRSRRYGLLRGSTKEWTSVVSPGWIALAIGVGVGLPMMVTVLAVFVANKDVVSKHVGSKEDRKWKDVSLAYRAWVKMPGTPVETQTQGEPAPDGFGDRRGSVTTYTVKGRNRAYLASYAELPPGVTFDYMAAIQGIARESAGKLLRARHIILPCNNRSIDGKTYEIEANRPLKGLMLGRMFVYRFSLNQPDYLFQLLVYGSDVGPNDPDAQRFLSSFHF